MGLRKKITLNLLFMNSMAVSSSPHINLTELFLFGANGYDNGLKNKEIF